MAHQQDMNSMKEGKVFVWGFSGWCAESLLALFCWRVRGSAGGGSWRAGEVVAVTDGKPGGLGRC